MALKDWKKVKEIYEGKSINSWKDKITKEQIYVFKSFNEWGMVTSKYSDKANYFKTKSKALAYAKAYMRKY